MEALVKQFRQLNINKGERDLVLYEQNTLVPFKGSFDPIKKQHLRPKVDLDEETDKVWKLLLLDINHDGVDGTDEDKAKWWEEERNVFRGRAESFIARMHLVQGICISASARTSFQVYSIAFMALVIYLYII